jgi:hypothetical protein
MHSSFYLDTVSCQQLNLQGLAATSYQGWVALFALARRIFVSGFAMHKLVARAACPSEEALFCEPNPISVVGSLSAQA